MTLNGIRHRYARRITKLLKGIRDAVQKAGLETEREMLPQHDEGFKWSFMVNPDPIETCVDVSFTIIDGKGADRQEGGLNFSLQAVTYEGQILGEVIPFNFTDKVWVDLNDPKAVEARFLLLEEQDPEEWAKMIKDGLKVEA